jgi:bifunctional non-homologous end joining protein LigD
MLWRNSRGRPLNSPAAFIHPCQPTVAKEPPSGSGWAHELKHDGYRLQIHVRNGRVKLYTMNGNDWTKRYPRIVEEAARLREPLIIDAEVVHLSADGVSDFDALHSRTADEKAIALAFDLLLSGEDIRRQPLIERKTALKWVLRKAREGIQYVEHAEGYGDKLFAAVCNLGLEGIVTKKLNAPYRSGPSRTWIKVKNPNARVVAHIVIIRRPLAATAFASGDQNKLIQRTRHDRTPAFIYRRKRARVLRAASVAGKSRCVDL